jgi:hypothetical protein
MKRAVSVVVSGIVAGIFCFGYVQFRKAQRTAEATREASKMMELRTRLAPELETFYQKHDKYPASLKDLPLENFHWGGEGSTPKDLDSFSYISEGQTFVMRWKGNYGYNVYLAGKKGESIFSESETNNIQLGLTNSY